jgi:hypothetical protein
MIPFQDNYYFWENEKVAWGQMQQAWWILQMLIFWAKKCFMKVLCRNVHRYDAKPLVWLNV